MMTGYNFTESVRRVLAAAREEAAALRHEYVGTEHMLLATLRVEGSVAHVALTSLGVDLAAMRAEVIGVVKAGRGERGRPDLPYTSRAKKVIELAMSQALKLGNNYVGTEHLLLGMIAEEKGVAAQLLRDHGVTLEIAQQEIGRVLDAGASESAVTVAADTERFVRGRPATPLVNERLRAIMNSAFESARGQGCRIVTPVHLAVALLDHGEGLANAVFERLGLNAMQVRAGLEAVPSPAAEPIAPDDALRVEDDLRTAIESECRAARAPHVSTAHLALALLQDRCPVAPVFAACGVTRAAFAEQLARISG